jgi:NAD+ synthase
MDYQNVSNQITSWLKNQLEKSNQKGFVVGISGGIDSAVVSTLCAETGMPTIAVSLPIAQHPALANEHIAFLRTKFLNVRSAESDLSNVFYKMENELWGSLFDYNPHAINTNENHDLVSANLRSRLRMCALYAFANASGFLVAGTGNKVEDFGIGFFTKHGDGAVDLSPIGDLMKSEVRGLAKHLGIIEDIVKAVPADGLWNDNRSDEDQIGATYDELEWAMNWTKDKEAFQDDTLSPREKEVLEIYINRHHNNQHKMKMPPVCIIERS